MSRSTPITSQTPPTTEPAPDAGPTVLSAVVAAADLDRCDDFNECVAVARTRGASQTAIVDAYAQGGLRRLERGLPAISFGWSGRPFR